MTSLARQWDQQAKIYSTCRAIWFVNSNFFRLNFTTKRLLFTCALTVTHAEQLIHLLDNYYIIKNQFIQDRTCTFFMSFHGMQMAFHIIASSFSEGCYSQLCARQQLKYRHGIHSAIKSDFASTIPILDMDNFFLATPFLLNQWD